MPVAIAIVAFLTGLIMAVLFERSRSGRRIAELEKSSRDHFTQWTEVSERLAEARGEMEAKSKEISDQKVAIARLEERREAERQSFEQMKAALPDTFKNLASEVLEKKSQDFATRNQVNLGQLLDPLRTRLKDFQEKIEAAHVDQAREGAALKQQVQDLVAANQQISQEANNLAEALKGSNKTQGNWGELVLERILESAGLRRGEEYDVQVSHALENGGRAQPDVVLHLPEGKHLIVDSKVSLTAYEACCNAPDERAKAAALAAHVKSVRAHIKELSEKNYQALYGVSSLDFTILFLPIEPALMVALAEDGNLWESAWRSNVLMVSPSTLLFVLRTVASLWRQEQQQRNVQEIAKQGAKLYDKFSGFVDEMQGLGKELDQAQKKFGEAMKKLSTGNGNLIRQAETLRKMGVKPTRPLSRELVELAGEFGETGIEGEELFELPEAGAEILDAGRHSER